MKYLSFLLAILAVSASAQAETYPLSDVYRASCTRPAIFNNEEGALSFYLGYAYDNRDPQQREYLEQTVENFDPRVEYSAISTMRGGVLPGAGTAASFLMAKKMAPQKVASFLPQVRKLVEKTISEGFSNFDDGKNAAYRSTLGPAILNALDRAARTEIYEGVGLGMGLALHYNEADEVSAITEFPLLAPPLPCERVNEDLAKTVTVEN